MAIIKLKGNTAYDKDVYYEFDTDTEPLGEGGMGKVYRGRQVSETTGMSREVAIKFMFDGLPESVISRARREASIHAMSDNLVEMLGFIETFVDGPNNTKRSHYHVVSELLTGVMLADLLNGVTTTKDGRQLVFAQNLYRMYEEDRVNFALIIMKNIASGIMTLHDKGYIHRDIDPTNIMVTSDGKIKLIDFGIAKKLPNHTTGGDKLTTQDRALTMTGQFMGKPHYAAPELVVGDIDNQDQTTDIYAMGILFYQLLVGKLPFTGPITKVLEAQKNIKTPVKNISGFKDAKYLRKVVAKATEKDQTKRYQTAAEFRVALDAKVPVINWWKRLAYVACSVVGVILVVLGIIFFPDGRKDDINTIKKELYNSSTAQDGWEHLLKMGDADALYLQSRIYYEGNLPDSIVIMKNNLKGIVIADKIKAHSLLEKSYSLNSRNVHVLYDLGVDWYYGEDHGVRERNLYKAKQYFEEALRIADQTKDAIMQNRIRIALDTFAE
ncbi:MAG: serine/threonine-protein kinase [Muribaculaceae bacterium]